MSAAVPAEPGTLVDSQAAAVAAGVSPATVRSWARRGRIERHGLDDKGRTLYSLAAIYRAKASTDSRRTGHLR